MGFTCERCGWWADVNGVCICGYSGRPTTRHDSCVAWKTSIVTNADRIRAMTDEELAVWIHDIDPDNPCPPDGSCSCNKSNCIRGWLDWLKSPVEEVRDGT